MKVIVTGLPRVAVIQPRAVEIGSEQELMDHIGEVLLESVIDIKFDYSGRHLGGGGDIFLLSARFDGLDHFQMVGTSDACCF